MVKASLGNGYVFYILIHSAGYSSCRRPWHPPCRGALPGDAVYVRHFASHVVVCDLSIIRREDLGNTMRTRVANVQKHIPSEPPSKIPKKRPSQGFSLLVACVQYKSGVLLESTSLAVLGYNQRKSLNLQRSPLYKWFHTPPQIFADCSTLRT